MCQLLVVGFRWGDARTLRATQEAGSLRVLLLSRALFLFLLHPEAGDHVGPAAGIHVDLDQLMGLRVFQKLAEGPVPVIPLVEGGLLPLHRVLDHRGIENRLVLPQQGLNRIEQQLEGLLLLLRHFGPDRRRMEGGTRQVFIVDEFVAAV